MNNIKFAFFNASVGILVFCTACHTKTDDAPKTVWKITHKSQLVDTYFKTYPLKSVDSTVEKIKAEVSPDIISWAFECAYYQMLNRPSVTDSTLMCLLDTYQRTLSSDTVRAFCQLQRGHLFTQKAQLDTAYTCLIVAEQLFSQAGLYVKAADVTRRLGGYYYYTSDYPKCVAAMLKAFSVYEKTFLNNYDDGRRFEVMLDLGNIYSRIKDPVEAYRSYQRAWQLANQFPSDDGGHRIASAVCLAKSYLARNQLDSASYFLDKVTAFQKQFTSTYYLPEYHLFAGNFKLAKGEYAAALADFRTADSLNIDPSSTYLTFCFQKGLGDAYFHLNALDSAFLYYSKALKTPDSLTRDLIHTQLSIIAQKKGNYKAAFFHQKQSNDIKAALFTTERSKEIARQQIKADLESRELALREEGNTLYMRRYFAYLFGLVLLIGSSAVVLKEYLKQIAKYKIKINNQP